MFYLLIFHGFETFYKRFGKRNEVLYSNITTPCIGHDSGTSSHQVP